MSFIGAILGSSLLTGLVLLVINAQRDERKASRLAVARLRAMLLDVDRIEELAVAYLKPASPPFPAYRMPTSLLEGCILWFAEGSKLWPQELRALHQLLGDTQEVNRCLDQAHEARVDAVIAAPGGPADLLAKSEAARVELKCKNALTNVAKVRGVARGALRRFGESVPPYGDDFFASADAKEP